MLLRGDCLEQLKSLESDSVDSLVTDPPAGISFMGKHWDIGNDFILRMTAVFQETLRVMKPGAHGLVWALPRTSHWTATALEMAGFEIRDVITHLFGSGFPKSLDISKAIDKAAGAEREVVGVFKYRPNDYEQDGPTTMKVGNGGIGDKQEFDITAPSTDEAKQWQGWGTALKPASEHWIVVRKPCSEKTIAANVVKHGTGGINIDACRIDPVGFTSGGDCKGNSALHMNKEAGIDEMRPRSEQHPQGRFPSNLVLDEVAAEMLDEQSGVLSLKGTVSDYGAGNSMFGIGQASTIYKDKGGASRFFYVAKASKKDRGEDNAHPTVKPTKLMEYLITLVTPPNGTVLDPFMGSGSTGVAAKRLGFQFIGIEKEQEYFEIAEKRINRGDYGQRKI